MEKLTQKLLSCLYRHQRKAIEELNKYEKCLIKGISKVGPVDKFINKFW